MVLPEQILIVVVQILIVDGFTWTDLIADGDGGEVDALGVDDLHVHGFGIISEVDQSLTHEPEEKPDSAENSDRPEHTAKREVRGLSDKQMITMLGDNIGICDTYRLEM